MRPNSIPKGSNKQDDDGEDEEDDEEAQFCKTIRALYWWRQAGGGEWDTFYHKTPRRIINGYMKYLKHLRKSGAATLSGPDMIKAIALFHNVKVED